MAKINQYSIFTMKASDFDISARIPAPFIVDYSVDDVPFVSKRDVLDYMEHLMLSNGSIKHSASHISDLIANWRCPTRVQQSLYK